MAQWIAACQADDIDPEDVIPLRRGDRDYAIYRSPADVYYATDGHCTHEKTLLCDGLVSGGTIECPKHNGRFDYTSGKALGAPVLVDIRTYPAKVTNGTVYIDIEDLGRASACSARGLAAGRADRTDDPAGPCSGQPGPGRMDSCQDRMVHPHCRSLT